MRLLDRENIHDPDTIPKHDKECRVGMADVHTTYPVAKVFDIPCSQRILKLNKMFFYDPSVFFRQAVNVFQYLPIYFEVQTASPHLVSVSIHYLYPFGQNHPLLQPSVIE
jgi:hypothetical protein